ncbi:type 1 glutamine amidotransferase [Prauserella oleivorans]|uniref:Type 1 glutamine amidotransferase n=1 Tax=Prauserella oleivorans TaxID=1478153 RepID=A0ABW5W963_9PSEU
MSTRILVLQPDASDPPGRLGDWLIEAGADVDVRALPDDSVPRDLDGYQALVCLGGAMNVEDEEQYPWLAAVRRLLARATSQNVPTLGVCLGAQLLAVANGGRVVPGPRGPEVGPELVAKKDAAWVDPLFADLPLMQDVLQFHTHVVDQLPARAQLLASAPRYPHQAFRVNRCAYGIQFHIETTPDIVRRWAANSPDTAAAAREGAFEDTTLAAVHTDVAETWRPFAHRFVRLAAGDLEPAAEDQRRLPLA